MSRNTYVFVVLGSLLFCSSTVHAESSWMDNPLKRIVEITQHLNHFPGDSEKQELMQIMNAEGVNDELRIIAHALHNIQHSVNKVDQQELSRIANDTKVLESVRSLAKIIANLNHQPSESDKQVLSKLLGG